MSRSKQHDRNKRAIQANVGVNRDNGEPITKGKGNEHPDAWLNRAHQAYNNTQARSANVSLSRFVEMVKDMAEKLPA